MDLVLASSSPRRQDLLEEAGIPFRVIVPDIEEWDANSHPELSPHDLVRLNARRKAEAVHQLKLHTPETIILAADTIVVCEGRILGKPADLNDAKTMLAWLAARTHEVLTGVAWLDVHGKILREHVARTRVTFRPLDDSLIRTYLEKVHVLDKAGAYAAQEHGFDLIERVEGSLSNVIGLPMEIVRSWQEETTLSP
jgi:septum formation protein